jgi:DNA-binding Lrp family transcriptional regulator
MSRRTRKPSPATSKPYAGDRRAPTAGWSAPSLMTSLANSGWGELHGRAMQGVRSTLQALVYALPFGSAAGKATVADIAERAGLSLKWTARCMALLEDLGVIEWTRGGITIESAARRYGTPGWVRIVKARLVDLVLAARPVNDERQAKHRAETLARIAEIKTKYTRTRIKNQRSRRSDHVELSGHPTPLRGGTGGPRPRPTGPVASTDSTVPAARAVLTAAQAPRGYGSSADLMLPAAVSAPTAAARAARDALRRLERR